MLFVSGVRIRRTCIRGAPVRVRVCDTIYGHTRHLCVASLFQFRTRIVPESGVHAVRFRQRRLAVLRRDVLSLQEPDKVSHRNGVRPGEHLSRIFLHMLLFPVYLRSDDNGHMV